jgi:hypothetical protein
MSLEKSLSIMNLDERSQSLTEQYSKPYWHLDCRPWNHMVPLFEVLSKHLGKPYDDVAEIVDSDSSFIHNLLSEWNAKFNSQKALVVSLLSEWGQNYGYPQWNKDMPQWIVKETVNGISRRKCVCLELYEASQFFCFFPFTEYFFSIGYDYDHLTRDDVPRKDDTDLVAAMKNDYGITVKYTHLPLFGAVHNGVVDFWPVEVIQLSVAVPLLLGFMK